MSVTPLKTGRPPVALQSAEAVALWWRWTIWTAAGELAGFAVPALVMAAGTVGGWTDSIQLGAAVAVGAFEGAVLGLAQWEALRHILPQLSRQSWVLATSFGAVMAYLLAMIAVAVIGAATIPLWLVAVVCGLLVIGFLLTIGVSQWLVFRHYLPRAGWWIPANAVAWPLGTAVPFIGLALVPGGSSFLTWAVAGIVSGLVMGLVVGAVTGFVLVRLWNGRTKLGNDIVALNDRQYQQH